MITALTVIITAFSQGLSRNSSHHLLLLPLEMKLALRVGRRPELFDIQAAGSARTAFSHSESNSLLKLNFTFP